MILSRAIFFLAVSMLFAPMSSFAHRVSDASLPSASLFSQACSAVERSVDWLSPSGDTIDAMVRAIAVRNYLDLVAGGERCLSNGRISLCISPETSADELEGILMRLPIPSEDPNNAYNATSSDRWTVTASGGTGARGQPITLTYSFPADGMSVPGSAGEATSNNILNANLTAKFGSEATWKAKFAECFTRWGQVTGVRYVYEPNDDEAAFPSGSSGGASGVLGVRGDVRIVAHNIDGGNGILAYNFFPNTGDMVLDSSEGWGSFGNNYRFFRNTVMHEHAHGLGMGHVYPTNGTKLMEPYLNTNFDGPQDDDIRGGQYLYGDTKENNGTSALATNLGALTSTPTNLIDLSTHGSSDQDWHKFTVPANSSINASIAPVGSTYQVGNSSGSTPTVNTLAINNLQIQVYNTNGTSILLTQNANGAGLGETIAGYALPAAAGTYFLRVTNVTPASDSPQRYTLSASLAVPTVTITAPANNAWVRGTVNLTGTITGGGASPAYTWKLDGSSIASGNSASPSHSWNTTGVSAGNHTISLDGPGGVSASITVRVDNTLPVADITAPANNAVVKGTIAITGAVTEANLSNWVLRADATTIGSGSGASVNINYNTAGLTEGSHTIMLTATDLAGNVGTDSITIVVDRTAPTTQVTAPTNNSFAQPPVTVTGTITDANPNTWQLKANGNVIGSGTGTNASANWSPADGVYSLTLEATDKAGTTGVSSAVLVTVDNTDPVVTITAPTGGSTVSGTVNISGAISDANQDTWRIKVDGNQIASGTGSSASGNWSAPSDGASHTIRIEATDKAGNTGFSQITVNTPVPTVTFTGTVMLRGWVGNINTVTVEVIVDGGSPTNVALVGSGNTGTFTLQLPASGTHSVKVKPRSFLSQTAMVTTSGSPTGFTFNAGGPGMTPGDVSGDNIIDDTDVTLVILDFGSTGPFPTVNGYTDTDGDGEVNDGDLTTVVQFYGQSGS